MVSGSNTLVTNTVYKIGYGQWQGPTVSSLHLSIGLANGQWPMGAKGAGLDSGSIQLVFVCSCRCMRTIDNHRNTSNKTFDFKSNYNFTPFGSLISK